VEVKSQSEEDQKTPNLPLKANDVDPPHTPPEAEEGGGDFYEIQYPVIKMIDEYMVQHPVNGKKMTVKIFSERSGISFTNLSGIVNGYRWIARCNRDLIDKLAAFLEVPVLQIFIMSGFIKAEDVVITQSLDKTLDLIHQQMLVDQAAAYRVPGVEAWSKWPQDAKLCLCMMYEAYTHKRLMRYAAVAVQK
jgi:hypothetical protein